MKAIRFDPRVFISPPYKKCPKCGEMGFGVLTINANSYSRRCRECFYPKGGETPCILPLPQLNKKIFYIDQFAISNMMKIINPDTEASRANKIDEFWLTLFDKIHHLCKMQVIICPDSYFHANESMVTPFYKALKRVYELLSHGITFYDKDTIQRFQILEHAKNWIKGNQEFTPNFNIESITHGDINAWQDRIIVTVEFQYQEPWIEEVRASRQRTHEGMLILFEQWQKEKDLTFDDWFNRESIQYGKSVLEHYYGYYKRLEDLSKDMSKITVNDLYPSNLVLMVNEIQTEFIEMGVPKSDALQKTVEYLTSPIFHQVPFVKISALLLAGLARKAASGQKRPPSQGMVNDIFMISNLLPYCDVMFLDNECATLLQEGPICDRISEYDTKIFSLNSKEDFMNYLDEIEKSIPETHKNLLNDVYGEDWLKSYFDLFKE